MKNNNKMEKSKKLKEEKDSEVKNSTLIYGGIGIFFFVIFLFAFFIYGLGWENSLVQKAESIIPYPAAIIENTKLITIGELRKNNASVKKFYESQDFSKIEMRVDFTTESGQKRLKIKEREILNRMIEDKIIEIISKKRKIRVTDEMVDKNLQRKLEEYGNEEKLKENLKKLYGWTIEDFKEKVVKPDLYKEALENMLAKEDATVPEAKKQIEEAEKMLENKKNFAEVAKSYSKGSTASEGGELGWFKKDQLIGEISQFVFSNEKGERSEIIESPLGFHLVKIEDKKIENGFDLARIRQIFVPKKTFAEFLADEIRNFKIWIPVKEFYWDKEKNRVEFRNENMRRFEKEIIQNSQGDASVLF